MTVRKFAVTVLWSIFIRMLVLVGCFELQKLQNGKAENGMVGQVIQTFVHQDRNGSSAVVDKASSFPARY